MINPGLILLTILVSCHSTVALRLWTNPAWLTLSHDQSQWWLHGGVICTIHYSCAVCILKSELNFLMFWNSFVCSLNRNFHCLLYFMSGPALWQIVNVDLWQIWSGYRALIVESTCWLPSIHLIRWLSGTPRKKQSCGRSHTQKLLWASTLIPSHLQNLHVSLSPVCFM